LMNLTTEQREAMEDLLLTLASPTANMNDQHAATALVQFRRIWMSKDYFNTMKLRVGSVFCLCIAICHIMCF
jgi:hypothetical protein